MVSYSDFIARTTSDKILLIEIDVGQKQQLWYNDRAWVWACRWRIAEDIKDIGDGNIGDGNIGAGMLKNFIKIGSCFGGGEVYTEQVDYADVVTTEKSWYYDGNNFILYIHCVDNDEPQIHYPIIGMIIGISNKGGYYDGLFYEPRLKEVMTIDKSKDSLYYGIIRYDGGSMSFRNNDGFFDGILDNIIAGQPIRGKFGGDDLAYGDFEDVFTCYIENAFLDVDEFNVSVIDNRKKLSLKLPINKFKKGTGGFPEYQYLDDDDIGKDIPLGYGEIYHAPVICVNKTQTGTPGRIFKVCDTSMHNGIEDVIAFYKKVDDGYTTVAFTEQLADGTVTITDVAWKADGGDKKKYVCDYKGVKTGATYLQNPLDIIADIFTVFLSVVYNDTNYNTTEWVIATAHEMSDNIGLFLGKQKRIDDIIEMISNGLGNFIVQDDTKFTFRIFDEDKAITATVDKEEMLQSGGLPQINWDGAEFLSSANIGYKRDWSKNTYRWYLKDDLRNKIYSEYKRYSDEDFETLLTNETDAIKRAEHMMNLYQIIPPIYDITTKTQYIQTEIMDMMNFQVNRISDAEDKYVKVEIVNLSKNLLDNLMSLSGRYIEDA